MIVKGSKKNEENVKSYITFRYLCQKLYVGTKYR